MTFNFSNSNSEKLLTILSIVLLSIGGFYLMNAILNVATNPNMPVDQALRYWEIKKLFFEGKNIFIEDNFLVYPPSFLLLMTPLLGLFGYETSKWVWLIVQIVSLVSISFVLFELTNTYINRKQNLLISSIFLAWHSSYQAIGIGQLPVVLFAMFLVSFFYVTQHKDTSLFKKITITLFLTIALGKYTIFLPLYAFLVFDKRFTKYIILSFLINFSISSTIIFSYELSYSEYLANYLAKYSGGYTSGSIDLHSILKYFDVSTSWLIVYTLLFLSLPIYLGLRNYSLLTGLVISSIIGRFWMYHGIYDNVMLLPILLLLAHQLKSRQWNSPTYSTLILSLLLIIPARLWNPDFILAPFLQLIFPIISVILAVLVIGLSSKKSLPIEDLK